MIDFETLVLKKKPNQYLVAPDRLCAQAKTHRTAPVFNTSVTELREAWDALVEKQPRIQKIAADEENLKFEIIQRSLVFRFPDVITVQFLSMPQPDKSTLAIYSRSKIGYRDFDVNKNRINDWLDALASQLGASDQ